MANPHTRGMGQDRRPLIIIDGKSYTRHQGEAASGPVARRIAAKRFAFELALALGELIGVVLIVASIVLLAVAAGG